MSGPIHYRASDGANNVPVSVAEPLPVTIPAGDLNIGNVDVASGPTGASALQVQGPAADNAAAVGSPILVGGVYPSGIPVYSTGDVGNLQLGSRGFLRMELGDGSGNLLSLNTSFADGGAFTNSVGVKAHNALWNGATWDRQRKPNAASRIASAAADTNPTVAKASAGDVHVISGYNAAAVPIYLKFYDKATAPTVGTDTIELALTLPPTSAFNINLNGHYFGTGIAYGLTTASADNGTTALTAADILGLSITYA